MSWSNWRQILDAAFLVAEGFILFLLLSIHPTGEHGFDAALRVAGQTLLGSLVSVASLVFAVVTRKSSKVQRRFVPLSIFTTVAWGLLFMLASTAV